MERNTWRKHSIETSPPQTTGRPTMLPLPGALMACFGLRIILWIEQPWDFAHVEWCRSLVLTSDGSDLLSNYYLNYCLCIMFKIMLLRSSPHQCICPLNEIALQCYQITPRYKSSQKVGYYNLSFISAMGHLAKIQSYEDTCEHESLSQNFLITLGKEK